ncbi:MAG: GNAT family N-acetyltransferase [Alphaproteobacteria bacterium]
MVDRTAADIPPSDVAATLGTGTAAAPIGVRVERVADIAALGKSWRALEDRANASFFQSWSWIGCWLDTLPAEAHPDLLVARTDGETVGLALLGRRRGRRHRILPVHGLHLNETGDPALDCLTIEHNGILAPPDLAEPVVVACLDHLAGAVAGWDEFHLGGVPTAYLDLAAKAGLVPRIVDVKPSPYVDLDGLRAGGGDYLAGRSRNTRQQLRRALRDYEPAGPLRFEVAGDLATATAYFTGLENLHQASWRARGRPGAFANPFFAAFHRRLIETAFDRGEIQLAHVVAGDETVAYLYSFVRAGRVSFYQGGLAYSEDPRRKPGLVAHYLAIAHNLESGAGIYDFLAGDSRYKRSLATDSVDLLWATAQKPRLKYRLEALARGLKGRIRAGASGDAVDRPGPLA